MFASLTQKLIVCGVIGIGLVFLVGILRVHAAAMSDDFESYTDNQILADTNCYNFVAFPGVGAGDDGTCISDNWEMDTGQVEAQNDSSNNQWGFLPNTDLFRLNTQETTQDSMVEFRYKASGTSNAQDVWLRYQTQYWLYIVQFDRDDDCLVAKRKIPTNTAAAGEWGGIGAGRSAEIANAGVYYVLRIDADSPTPHGSSCNQDGVSLGNLTFLGVSGTSSVAHDGTLNGGTVYSFKATITTVPAGTGTCTSVAFDCTQLQLYRYGVLLASWTDKNDGYNVDKTRSPQQDCDAGYYTTVTGYQAAWCLPITAAGKSGIRNDDALQVWIDDFSMTEAGEEPPGPEVSSNADVTMRGGTLKIGGGRAIIK